MYYDINGESVDLEQLIGIKIRGSFLWLAFGLFLTFGMILLNSSVASFYAIFEKTYSIAIIVQIIGGFSLALLSYKASAVVLKSLFVLYALATGQTLTLIAFAYDFNSVLAVLGGTILLFTILAVYGYTTESNLLKYKTFLTAGIISIIIIGIINIFLKSDTLTFIFSILGVIVFVIYTAYDTYIIKNNIIYAVRHGQTDLVDRIEIVGAFALYLDFINLFLNLLRLFGKRRK
ncbi:Bax inhibitor-1 family protein [Caviibacter abscessus]|uniref:Bax inhibitor-1 family protein n=1 Tax=Caviibacter abscessus TaxID=1766719 RepID=UPI00083387AA|nr:Bax inhibitor-1 family protein [Caviibacter abscessus]